MVLRLVNVDDLPIKSDAADFSNEEIVGIVDSPKLAGSLSFQDFMKWITHTNAGRSTEYPSLDKVLKFPDVGVVVIAGRTKHGKTTLMKNIALRKAMKGEKVYFYSLETATAQMLFDFSQMLESDSSISNVYEKKKAVFEKVRNGSIPDSMIKLSKILEKNLFIIYNGTTLNSIISQLMMPELRGATIFLDYLQKIQAGGQGSALDIQEVMNRLVEAALKNNLLIITGSQLTQYKGMSAIHDEVKGSRSIEEGASLVLRIWRQGVSGAMDDLVFQYKNLPFTVDVKLNRDGPCGDRVGLMLGGMNLLTDPLDQK